MWHTISTRDNWSSNCGPCKIDFDSDWQDLVELVTDQANLRVSARASHRARVRIHSSAAVTQHDPEGSTSSSGFWPR